MSEIKKITKYSYENREFDTLEGALNFKALFDKAHSIMSVLKNPPDNITFSNGDGYIQHPRISLGVVYGWIGPMLIKEYGSDPALIRAIENKNWGWVGRFYAEGHPIFHSILSRLMCIDEDGREFGQPYFVTHPNKAKLHEVK